MGRRLSLADRIHIFKQRPDFVCLPEYWMLDETVGDYHRAALNRTEYLEYLSRTSEELTTCLVGGTVVEADEDRLYNVCPIFDRGRSVGRYRKMHPTEGEISKGITPGDDIGVFDVDGVRIGVMVCADVFYPEHYLGMAAREVDLIFVPTVSPLRPDDTINDKQARDDRYFVSGALDSGAYTIKVCGVGSFLGKPLQGRTLVAAPWGLLDVVDYNREHATRILSITLDLDELHDFRRKIQRAGVGEA